MRKARVNLLLLLSICFLSATVYAGLFSKEEAGTAGAQFLKIGCGVRAIGMGEAYTGVADEVNAVYWNPAGLNHVKNIQVSAMHAVWLEEMNYDYAAYVHPLSSLGGVIGVSINYLSMGGMDRLDEYGEVEGTFSSYDAAVNVAYAWELGSIMSGINLKFIQQEIADEKATGYAVDLGMMYRFLEDRVQLGCVVKNIGPEIKFIEESAPLPLSVRFGIGYKLNKDLILAFDIAATIDEDPGVHVGCEYTFNGIKQFPVACRIGYKTATVDDLDAISGLSAGMGVEIHGLDVDYAWVPYGDLGDTHRISLGMKFGKKTEEFKQTVGKKGGKKDEKKIAKAKKYYIEGVGLYKGKKYKQAIKKMKKVLKLNPKHKEGKKIMRSARIRIYYRKGVEYYKSEEYDLAIYEMKKILKISPKNKSAKKLIKKAKEKLKKEKSKI